MIKACFILMTFLSGVSSLAESSPSSARKIQVFVLAGQSNMDGRADFEKISDADKERLRKVQDRVKLAYNLQPVGTLTGAKGNEGLKKKFGAEYSFGPEIFFAIGLAEANPQDEILLIKRSVGATSLYGRWNPEWDETKARVMGEENAAPLYPDMIAYVWQVLSGYPRNTFEIRGMLWVQGETDSGVSKFGPAPAKAYGENIEKLIARARKDLGVPELPFLMMRIAEGDVGRGMDAAAAKLKNVTVVPRSRDPASHNFLQQYEVGHYNHVGMKRMGELFADAWLPKYDKPAPQQASVVSPMRKADKVVAYKSTPQIELKLHFYFPPGWSKEDRRPAMAFWCGGGFRSGRSPQFMAHAEYFASRGFVAVHVDYRGTQTEGVPVRDCQEDARSAMRWLKAHAVEYGINAEKIIASGGSAGGALAMMTAWKDGPDSVQDDLKISPQPAALVLFNPAMGEAIVKEIGVGGPEQAAFNQQVLALREVPPSQPPTIMFFGERDEAYLGEAKNFLAEAREYSVPCEVWVARQQVHGFFNRQPWHNATVRLADEFLVSLGYLQGAPSVGKIPAAALEPASLP